MALKKITEADLVGRGVAPPFPDKPSMSADELKNRFEETARKVIIPIVNGNVDALLASTGAREIGAAPPQDVVASPEGNVQGVLNGLRDYVNDKVREIGAGDMGMATYDTASLQTDIFRYACDAVAGNLLMNGGFDIWQRGASFDFGSSTTLVQYGADRWNNAGGACKHTQVGGTSPLGTKYALRVTAKSGSGAHAAMQQLFEDSLNLSRGATLSFYARASVACEANISAGSEDKKISLETGWKKYTLGFSPAFATGLYVGVGDLASGAWFEVAGMMLNHGPAPLEYTAPTYTDELLRCQRYYYKFAGGAVLHGFAVSTAALLTFVQLPVPLRVADPVLEFTPTQWTARGNGTNIALATAPTIDAGATRAAPNMMRLSTALTGLVSNQSYVLYCPNNVAHAAFDAEIY